VATFSDLFARLDPDPRVRGKQFEHVCKWFLTNDPTYTALLRRVWLWKEWPDRWSDAEAGIDLVAKDFDGHLWAIQAKAYAEDRPVPKRELNKFLSESNRPVFSYRLLISATSEGLHHIAQGTVDAQEKPVFILERPDLEKSPVQWPTSPDDLRPSPPAEPAQPRDYQEAAIRDVVNGFATANLGQLLMACGTGKTLTAWFIADQLAAERTLVLVPSLSLLKQTMREWQNSTGSEVRFASLPVCSDATVVQRDDAPVHTCDLGVPVTTDPAEIAAFMRKPGTRVVFATYHSSPQIAKAFELGTVPAFDLVIADEAHRCAGPVSSDFATVLDTGKIEAKRRLFMTATPRVYSESTKRAAKEEDFEYASMDDPQKFGEVFHKLGFSEAIERRLLTDYQVAVIGIDDSTYGEWVERGTLVTLDGTTPVGAQKVAGQIGLAKAMRKYDLRRTISFHSYVTRAQEFAGSMPKVIAWMPPHHRPTGALWAKYASGEMDAGKRSRLIQRLADLDDGERGLLSNARCLAEGVDVPTLDGVAFIDPRRSEVDIVQAVGRAIRKADNKKVGTIVIPVFIDTDADPEVVLRRSVFKPVWDVIRALRSHDEELGRQLDELRQELGRHGGKPRLPIKIHVDIPKKVDAAFAEAFDVRLVEQTTASWEFWFGLLEKFVQLEGTARVPSGCTVDGRPLGDWASTQRKFGRIGRLSPDRQLRLEQVHPTWTWNAKDARWEFMFGLLEQYVEQNGDAAVPRTYVTVDGHPLGKWVITQRFHSKKGLLDDERRTRLSELPAWAWDSKDVRWEFMFELLKRYLEEEGHASPSIDTTVDDQPLGRWVRWQRNQRRKGILNAERQERLSNLPGWDWHSHVVKWEEGYRHLVEYVEEYDDANVTPTLVSADGYPLGTWVRTQRVLYKQDKLGSDLQQRLELVHPTWTWSSRDSKWEKGFSYLLVYMRRNGHAQPKNQDSIDGYPLGKWVSMQRSAHREDKLPQERRGRLESVHPTWTWDARTR
jgi:superfamily II DNA or RNA helicase